jgi:uncharacterized protein (DUF39 family)
MAANAFFGSPRMGAIFGGMLLSGKRASEIIINGLKGGKRLKTIREINERIKKGEAVVLTADEIVELRKSSNPKKLAEEVDVVTTGTFGPMCSSGVFLNFGHSKQKIKIGGGKVYLNGVVAYSGLAAVDVYLGATSLPENDPRNTEYPGEFKYGGGHVIEDLVSGKEIELEIFAYGTDCYPKKYLKTKITINDINEAIFI